MAQVGTIRYAAGLYGGTIRYGSGLYGGRNPYHVVLNIDERGRVAKKEKKRESVYKKEREK